MDNAGHLCDGRQDTPDHSAVRWNRIVRDDCRLAVDLLVVKIGIMPDRHTRRRCRVWHESMQIAKELANGAPPWQQSAYRYYPVGSVRFSTTS